MFMTLYKEDTSMENGNFLGVQPTQRATGNWGVLRTIEMDFFREQHPCLSGDSTLTGQL